MNDPDGGLHAAFDPHCARCGRLAQARAEIQRQHVEYHCRPVPAFGDPHPRLLVVGLAPGLHGANRTGRPFTGDHAGLLLYRTLHRFGFASAPESIGEADGLRLIDCRITNAVKCWPPQNKPLPAEVANCNGFLRAELTSLGDGAAILALGAIAHGAVLRAFELKPAACAFAHGARHALAQGLTLHDSYHCSRYNTQTKRLTPEMFERVVGRVAAELGVT